MRIGELAELAGVTTRTVRHYHRTGLLPEPARRSNGYRSYELRDAVRLLRVRRLVDLGLNLDEVADALADDEGRELREILAGLDADLADEEQRIRAHRERISRLLASVGDLARSAELTEVLGELDRTVGAERLWLDRERDALELLEAVSGDRADVLWTYYRTLLADGELTERTRAAAERFEQLADVAPDDPAVRQLADEAGEFAALIIPKLPAENAGGPNDPNQTELLMRAITAGMSPAQSRCLELMMARWAQAGS